MSVFEVCRLLGYLSRVDMDESLQTSESEMVGRWESNFGNSLVPIWEVRGSWNLLWDGWSNIGRVRPLTNF